MNRLNIYVLKQFIAPLFATFFIIIFVLLMQFLWMFVDDLVGKGLETIVVLEFFYYAFLRLILQALPLTILLSSIMTFGSLGEKLELLSMKAAGVSLIKVMRPMIVLVSMMTIGAFFFTNEVESLATRKLATLRYDISRKNPEMNLKEKVFNYDIPHMAIKIESKNEETGMLYDLMIYFHNSQESNTILYVADSGRIGTGPDGKTMALTLHNGQSFSNVKEENKRYDRERAPYRRDTFSMQVMMLVNDDELKRSDDRIYSSLWFAKRMPELKQSVDSLIKVYNINSANEQRTMRRSEYKVGLLVREEDDFDALKDSMNMVKMDSLFQYASIKQQTRMLELAVKFSEDILNKSSSWKKRHEGTWQRIRKHQAEIHKRYTIPLSCLIFFFIGAPLGAIIRKGGFGMPVIISIILFVLWYIINTFGTKMATEGISPVWMGMWLSSFKFYESDFLLSFSPRQNVI